MEADRDRRVGGGGEVLFGADIQVAGRAISAYYAPDLGFQTDSGPIIKRQVGFLRAHPRAFAHSMVLSDPVEDHLWRPFLLNPST